MANPLVSQDSGYNGQIISLAGIHGQYGIGRQNQSNSFTLAAGNPVLIAPANPKRISLVIQNIGDPAAPGLARIGIYLGSINVIPVILTEFGVIQIDIDYPWTGEIYAAINNAYAPVVVVNDIGIQ